MHALRWVLALVLVTASMATAAAVPRLHFEEFDRLERALDLTPEQKEQYDVAVGATKRMVLQVALVGLQMKERLAEELAKPRPDFGILREFRQSLVEDGRSLRREARDEWVKLYRMLNEDQLAAMRRFTERHFDHLGLLHDFMMELIRRPPPPAERT